jgi:hypothetical protein
MAFLCRNATPTASALPADQVERLRLIKRLMDPGIGPAS